MTNNADHIISLSIKQLLDKGNGYIIPIYQRNYAWGETEIIQLIQDIIDTVSISDNAEKNYYLGTLVIYNHLENHNAFYETIDGQQRLTTLSVLASVIKNTFKDISLEWFGGVNLEFESRKNSSATLKAAYNGSFNSYLNYSPEIKNAYELIEKILPLKLSEYKVSSEQFCEYFFNKVKILRVPVPEDTNLNHYFEIMNNRGEQLEKHEILKSTLLESFNHPSVPLSQENLECFNLIWEACSNMEKYLQYGFSPEQRSIVFSDNDWDQLAVSNFDEICFKLAHTFTPEVKNTIKLPVSEIIFGKTIERSQQKEDDSPDRFNSVINFPNFLLHVLRVQTKADIPLDDKRLLTTFESHIAKQIDKVRFAKDFAFNLLKCKYLLDRYIIKREYIAGKDNWSLKRLKRRDGSKVSYVNTFTDEFNGDDSNDNRTIIMLLSMFHVSTPTMVYKHWLSAALNYVFYQSEVSPNAYIDYLESLGKAFLFDRFLATEPKEYFDIIFSNSGKHLNSISDIDTDIKLTFGNITNNLVFNFLDYLLWKKYAFQNNQIKDFVFTPRSSVEHYYPRIPLSGIASYEAQYLNSFGNLCLISRSKNSKLSNYLPVAKKQHYANSDIDSIKQYKMMHDYNPEKWNIDSIVDHCNKMTQLLLSQLDQKAITQGLETTESEAIVDKHPGSKSWVEDFMHKDPVLLARAVMCFGRIDYAVGWTTGGGKWNFLQWDRINKSDSFKSFVNYANANKHLSLEEIIKVQLEQNQELMDDSYRYVFISRPEILEYCLEGNFGWINDGAKIILMQGSRAGMYNSCELYTFLLKKYMERQRKLNTFCYNDRLRISLEIDQSQINLVDYIDPNDPFLEIWNDGKGTIYYEINTRKLHGNSMFIKLLKDLDCVHNEKGNYYLPQMPVLTKLSNDIEDNIIKSQKALARLIKFIEQ